MKNIWRESSNEEANDRAATLSIILDAASVYETSEGQKRNAQCEAPDASHFINIASDGCSKQAERNNTPPGGTGLMKLFTDDFRQQDCNAPQDVKPHLTFSEKK